MKVRLVGGPFGGQVKEMGPMSQYGRSELVMRGPKKMTRKQKYEHMMNSRGPWQAVGHTTEGSPVSISRYGPEPFVEARYRIAMRVHTNGDHLMNMPCQHPDGSLFYEYVDKSKREL